MNNATALRAQKVKLGSRVVYRLHDLEVFLEAHVASTPKGFL